MMLFVQSHPLWGYFQFSNDPNVDLKHALLNDSLEINRRDQALVFTEVSIKENKQDTVSSDVKQANQ